MKKISFFKATLWVIMPVLILYFFLWKDIISPSNYKLIISLNLIFSLAILFVGVYGFISVTEIKKFNLKIYANLIFEIMLVFIFVFYSFRPIMSINQIFFEPKNAEVGEFLKVNGNFEPYILYEA